MDKIKDSYQYLYMYVDLGIPVYIGGGSKGGTRGTCPPTRVVPPFQSHAYQ